ncbi:nucleoside phosphorylase [Paenibacillus cucumis (ex Kampfer et al. 2016)]|uniref:Uridine phosphorylase n=1 Tax=Paenibacillus cucumis (ex Kampfer et al. 2016) TaxID=1776858 RepID=A0ABS7KQI0_9BACL|nr:nucleoside phosphorylase [Paenibacillus cucumis (ex Kampfer et al. 2016)]MBY0206438.1 nucleoside phosphorylase [Paenibacillus cucumis (ex Kampfer et al. 2016)]
MLMPILQIHSEDMPAYAVVCGDPARAEKISRKLENARELAFSREYRTFVGEYEGIQMAVVSHGVGSPGAAVCFEELIRAGVKTLIRVGTAGSYTADYPAGSVIVSTAAVRSDGLTRQLVPDGFPAVADIDVTSALVAAARETGSGKGEAVSGKAGTEAGAASFTGVGATKVGVGITVTLDAFFTGVEEISHRKYKQAGALAAEMEIAALYIVSTLRGARAGAIVAIDGFADSDLAAEYDPHTDAVAKAVEHEINAALRALATLARQDQATR